MKIPYATSTSLAATEDIEQGKANLDRLGYTIHPNYIGVEQLEALLLRVEEQAELEREQNVATISDSGHVDVRIGGHTLSTPPNYQLINMLPNKGREFIELMMHPLACEYAGHAFRNVPFNLATQDAFIMQAGSRQQVVHADQQAWPFVTPIPVMINIMVCLSDFDADMGATRILPGSHLGEPPPIDRGIINAEALGMLAMTAKAGSALIWESRTWHCQGTHIAKTARRSIANVYATHFAKPQNLYPAALHDAVYATLSEAEKRMLGFEVAFEYAGRIGPRTPQDSRTNTNMRPPYIPELRRNGSNRAVAFENMYVARTAKTPTSVEN